MPRPTLMSLLKGFPGRFMSSEGPYEYLPLESRIEVVNFWPSQTSCELWLYQFFLARLADVILADNPLLLASVFGPRSYIEKSPSKIKVFFTGENVERFPKYKDHCLEITDLSLGFEYLPHPNYSRFPLWLFFMFPPASTQRNVQAELDRIMLAIRSDNPAGKNFCSLICSHDKSGNRIKLMHALSAIDRVDSAGRFRNNTPLLKEQFNDCKLSFLRNYKFNICPENTNKEGYVTEKIFEAIKSGCIPVYWGSNNNPEPDILNNTAILFYDGSGSIKGLQENVAALHHDPKLYREFMMQDRFQPHAAEYIAEMLNNVEVKIREIIKTKRVLARKWN